nr:uncharacterized protein LOC111505134 [Leptinotarsa decemlineata]
MDIKFTDGLTLEEALQIAYNDDLDADQIYIEPPNEGAITDEDSGGEDEGGLVDNSSRNQLNAPVQLVLHGEDDELVEPETEHVEIHREEKLDHLQVNRGDRTAVLVMMCDMII